MPWTGSYKFFQSNPNNEAFSFVVTFTDGKDRKFDKAFSASSTGANLVKKVVSQTITNLESRDVEEADFNSKVGQPVEPLDLTPTKEQQAIKDFLSLKLKLDNLSMAVEKGLAKPDQSYLDLQSAVKAAWKPKFAELEMRIL